MIEAAQEFWHWFKEHDDELFDFERDQEAIFDRLLVALHRVDPLLTFEFSPKFDGKREFVVSADGIVKAFPAVVALKDNAPQMSRWAVIAFRPRRLPLVPITYRNATLSPDDTSFVAFQNHERNRIDLVVGAPKHLAIDHSLGRPLVFLMLDLALGEFDVETLIGGIKVMDRTEIDERYTQRPIAELPGLLDDMREKLSQ